LACWFGGRSDEVQTSNGVFSTRGRKTGAMADIFVGYNVAFGPKVVAGVQGEGSVVQAMVTGNGTFAQIFNDVFVVTPPGGPVVDRQGGISRHPLP
jgi:hypothetical protein